MFKMEISRQNGKLVLGIIFLSLFSWAIGSGMGRASVVPQDVKPEIQVVEVTRRVEIPREKIVTKEVEVMSNECKVSQNNEQVWKEVSDVKGEVLLIVSDVFMNIDFYLENPEAVDNVAGKIEELDAKQEKILSRLQ